MGRKLDQSSVEAIAALSRQGLTRKQIAKRLGAKYAYIHHVIVSRGLTCAHKRTEPRKKSPELVKRDAAIVREVQAGKHVEAIAKKHGITLERVIQIAEAEGIPRADVVRGKIK